MSPGTPPGGFRPLWVWLDREVRTQSWGGWSLGRVRRLWRALSSPLFGVFSFCGEEISVTSCTTDITQYE